MSHQDQPLPLVINHQTLKQVIDWLLAPAVFAGLAGGSQGTWKPRLLAAAAVLWATSELSTLHERFTQARKIITKVFRWRPAPGVSYQGFLKMLGQWQDELLAAVVPQLRTQMQDALPAQWETAGYAVFAGDGSRVALARSESLEAAFAPVRRRGKARQRKQTGARRSPKNKRRLHGQKKATSPQLWLTLCGMWAAACPGRGGRGRRAPANATSSWRWCPSCPPRRCWWRMRVLSATSFGRRSSPPATTS